MAVVGDRAEDCGWDSFDSDSSVVGYSSDWDAEVSRVGDVEAFGLDAEGAGVLFPAVVPEAKRFFELLR